MGNLSRGAVVIGDVGDEITIPINSTWTYTHNEGKIPLYVLVIDGNTRLPLVLDGVVLASVFSLDNYIEIGTGGFQLVITVVIVFDLFSPGVTGRLPASVGVIA